jgi:Outer membrane receptor for Fe3+-dicitrate
MALVVPNVGEEVMLELILAPNLTLKLYTNNITPGETDTDLTYNEASGSGYLAKALVFGDWTITPGAPSEAVAPQQIFTFSGALGAVYGYFVIRASDGVLLWAERLTTAPFTVANSGDQIKITPRFSLD